MSEKELAGLFAQCLAYAPDVSSVWSIAVPEVDGPVRRADFVQIECADSTTRIPELLERLSIFRLLTTARCYLAVRELGQCDWEAVWRLVGHQRETVKRHLATLIKGAWLTRTGDGMYQVDPRLQVPAFSLVTYELKLHNWRQGMSQLISHQLNYSTYSWGIGDRPCNPFISNYLRTILSHK